MGKGIRYRSGDVVWAIVRDKNGYAKPDPRPLLVIQPDPPSKEHYLCCLAISTVPDRDDPAMEMPWDAKTGDTTGLRKWCQVILLWHDLVHPDDVEEKTGVVTQAFLREVMERRELAKQGQGRH